MEKIWLKHYPTSIAHEIPPIDKDITALFLEACKEFENQPAFRSFDKELSYGKLKELSLHLASELQSQGLKKGDRIIIQLPNILQYPVSLWASLLSGLTIVNMNPLYTSREMLHQIKDSGAKAIILFSPCAKNLEEIVNQTDLKTVIITGPGDLLGFPKKPIVNFVFKHIQKKSPAYKLTNGLSFLKALTNGSKKQPEIHKRDLDETIFIQYTGGTTGISKGACLSQKNILSNLKQCEFWITPSLERGKERALAPLPLYHIFAFLVNGLLLFLYGAENILIADPRQFQNLISTIKKYPVSTGSGVNSLFKALLQLPEFEKLDFSKCKFFVAGGMSLESSVQKQWKKITGVPIIEGYGLTEASPVVCCNSLQNPPEEGGYIGFPLPSTKIRIVNEQGEEQPTGEEGELEVKGPQVMQGYYQREQETQNVLKEGWLKTGDIAVINEKGLVKIKDRKKDMINVSGFNVFPNEVEEALCLHDAVKEAAVVGVKDSHSKEAVKAFVVKQSASLSEEELKMYCRKLLTSYKIPKTIEFVEEIPKTNIGKPLRRAFKS